MLPLGGWKRRCWKLAASALIGAQLFTGVGCKTHYKKQTYIGRAKPLSYYKEAATEINYPIVDQMTSETVSTSQRPRTLTERFENDQIWDMPLNEAIQLAISNNKIIKRNDRGSIQGGSSRVMAVTDQVSSTWDPAIQETGVLFGARGVESALAAFDTTFTTSMVWGRNEQIQNNFFSAQGLGPGSTLISETGQFQSGLQKNLATGGTFQLNHNWNYQGNNIFPPSSLFPSVYTGNVQAVFTQPLWAGAGTEFTRIAGPISQNFTGISGVTQGVSIARVNADITLTEFESNVTDMLYDVERAYWDLYNAYRQLESARVNLKSGFRTWTEVKAKLDVGSKGGAAADEAQAKQAYFERRFQAETAMASIDALEVSLRRMCGLPVNDGRIIRPADEPVTAEFVPDWNVSLAEALTRRVEIRRQKWQIKSLDLQLTAARSLTHPQLNFTSAYQVNGFGDKLLSRTDNDGVTDQGLNSAYETLTQGNQTGWNLGLQFSMPIGFRQAHAQVRNIELRLAKSRELLAIQEAEVSYEMANAFQELSTNWVNAQTNFNRRRAAEREVQAFNAEYKVGTKTLDLLLQAQARLATAENAYYTSLVNYTKAISYINYRKGTLLDMNNVHLAEGQWTPRAYQEALRRAWARTYAVPGKMMRQKPEPFASPDMIGSSQMMMSQPAPMYNADDNLPAPPAGEFPEEEMPTDGSPSDAVPTEQGPTELGPSPNGVAPAPLPDEAEGGVEPQASEEPSDEVPNLSNETESQIPGPEIFRPLPAAAGLPDGEGFE
ncbi:MAG: TolC family protein [Planctomycetaceae bacterium]|nr:TolC family protein [Planctomycetaceae bacterium]